MDNVSARGIHVEAMANIRFGSRLHLDVYQALVSLIADPLQGIECQLRLSSHLGWRGAQIFSIRQRQMQYIRGYVWIRRLMPWSMSGMRSTSSLGGSA